VFDKTEFDKQHIIHPYASLTKASPKPKIQKAKGVYLYTEEKKLIDGMSSWWCVIHGYNAKELNDAINEQLKKMAHVMFGGLTHDSAIDLAKLILDITDEKLEHIFFSDSGSVSVEVALKMAFEYHYSRGNKEKTKILSFQKAYHGDTFGAMSVCDPITGMHSIFNNILHKNIFAPPPPLGYNKPLDENYLKSLKELIKSNHKEIAACIIEPVVQGAGGMRIYNPKILEELQKMLKPYDILLIFDEIATGFGRTGKLFGYEHSNARADIMCIGKALTGGYMTLSATLCSDKVIKGIEQNGNILMHGPTFMANPLACAVSKASIELLLNSDFKSKVLTIQANLEKYLKKCKSLDIVKDVRVLGAIGVVELSQNCDIEFMTPLFLEEGVWIRPFLNLVYIMPPFIINEDELKKLTDAIYNVIEKFQKRENR
jgi:adenosylmethionine-8-amino-7-oxononanoate aminotransferase